MTQLPQCRTIENLALLVDEDLTASEVAQIRGKQYANARKVLLGLLASGYVSVTSDTIDVRNPRFSITPAGRELLAEIAKRNDSRREYREKKAAQKANKAEVRRVTARAMPEIPDDLRREPWGYWMYLHLVAPLELPCT